MLHFLLDNCARYQILYWVFEDTAHHVQDLWPLSDTSAAQGCQAGVRFSSTTKTHAATKHTHKSASAQSQIWTVALSAIIHGLGEAWCAGVVRDLWASTQWGVRAIGKCIYCNEICSLTIILITYFVLTWS